MSHPVHVTDDARLIGSFGEDRAVHAVDVTDGTRSIELF